jgi:hypothetical protein
MAVDWIIAPRAACTTSAWEKRSRKGCPGSKERQEDLYLRPSRPLRELLRGLPRHGQRVIIGGMVTLQDEGGEYSA